MSPGKQDGFKQDEFKQDGLTRRAAELFWAHGIRTYPRHSMTQPKRLSNFIGGTTPKCISINADCEQLQREHEHTYDVLLLMNKIPFNPITLRGKSSHVSPIVFCELLHTIRHWFDPGRFPQQSIDMLGDNGFVGICMALTTGCRIKFVRAASGARDDVCMNIRMITHLMPRITGCLSIDTRDKKHHAHAAGAPGTLIISHTWRNEFTGDVLLVANFPAGDGNGKFTKRKEKRVGNIELTWVKSL